MSDPGASRFTAQAASAEDILKDQTVGLVQLDEFRKRRRDVEELKSKDVQKQDDGGLTPRSEDGLTGPAFKKKKRKVAGRGLLSFQAEEDEETSSGTSTPAMKSKKTATSADEEDGNTSEPVIRKFAPNLRAGLHAPKIMTKAKLAAETAERERLRKDYIEVQEKVRATEVAIPFVFYDGSNIPGGMVKIKKGDHIWLFLERCRKVGAEMGVGGDRGDGAGVKARVDGKKSWARIGVDDLMCVRGEIIIPHHYELYYFIANKITDPTNPERLLFDYSGTADHKADISEEAPLLRRPKDEKLEGQDDDPSSTKVVDRRWYEKNKHIFPASLWKDYKVGKEFEDLAKGRRDAQGNAFFFGDCSSVSCFCFCNSPPETQMITQSTVPTIKSVSHLRTRYLASNPRKMDERVLTCNNPLSHGYCRRKIGPTGVVTTCSHIICEPCADATGFSKANPANRKCPTCKTPLPHEHDAVIANLNPTEEYKTSILSGLDPTTIMDCANRALSFWNYQIQTEAMYQQEVLNIMNEKYKRLSHATDKIVHDANAEIENLHGQIQTVTNEHANLERKWHAIATKDRERTKKFNDLRIAYDTLRKQVRNEEQRGITTMNAERAVDSMTIDLEREDHNHSTNGALHQVLHSVDGCSAIRKPYPNGVNVEQLHPHQRSGSVTSSGAARMPPPQRPAERIGRSPGQMNVQTTYRSPLPGAMRATANRAGVSAQQGHSLQTLFGSTTRQQLHTSNGSDTREIRLNGQTNGMNAGNQSLSQHRHASSLPGINTYR